MPRKRLISIVVIGCGLVGAGLFFLLFPVFGLSSFINTLVHHYGPPLRLVWMISTVIIIGYIIGGIQLLQLKELGRCLIIFLAIIDIPHLVVGKAIFNNYGLVPMYLRNDSFIGLSILVNLIIIFFLNHPKVREQFR